MKKVLLSGAAAAALMLASTPAMADDGVIDLELGGFFKAYGVFTDHDDDFGGVGTSTDRRSFDLRRSGLISFSGEATLDNGLTVGAVIEMETEDAANNNGSNNNHASFDQQFEESYIYFSGGWGRFNVGNEDGAGYLLQVAAPSADDNIDGVRQDISSFQYLGGAAPTADRLDYAMDVTWGVEKLTYLTPKFNGFQAGVSYSPEVFIADGINTAVAGMDLDNETNDFEHGVDIAARWDGEFEDVSISVGAGYTHASLEAEAAVPVAGVDFTDDWQQWNAALDLGFQAFGLGFAYMQDNNGMQTNGDTTTWVVGADWENGPYKLGLSYLDRQDEAAAFTGLTLGGAETDYTRITGGGSYAYGPGMSFRGSLSWINQDNNAVDEDAWQVAIGTDITF